LFISVIIPTYNEERYIYRLVEFILHHGKAIVTEVIVVDGQSTDMTVLEAQKAGAITLIAPHRSRAAQMNLGAKHSTGDVLFFVHADIKLVNSFVQDIQESIQSGYVAGCYRYQFDSTRTILKVNAYFTRFNGIMCRGGDQTLFIKKDIFNKLGGFDETFVIMEDYQLIQKVQKGYPFKIVPKSILVSARKYSNNSWLRVQLANLTIFFLYFLNHPPEKMAALYKRMLN